MTTGFCFVDYRTGSGLIRGITIDEIMETANGINALLITSADYLDLPKEKQKTGAILRITDIAYPEHPLPLLVRPFGFLPIENRPEYEKISLRKVGQLVQHPDHISSYQSRDGKTFWGGGYRLPERQLAITVSGHPELGDEALGLCLGMKLDWIDFNFATQVASLSNNFLFTVLCPQL